MKTLCFFAIFAPVSLVTFFLAACLISGTSEINKMPINVRQVVFGGWLIIVVIVSAIHAASIENPKIEERIYDNINKS